MHVYCHGSAYAIIGIGCRFPGHANSPEEFWGLLRSGVDAIGDIPEDRFDVRRFYDPDPARPGRSYVKRAGIADAVDRFDHSFFGISRREASHMDPQQRVLLEVAWEALEDAGLPADLIAGSRTGVYVGISSHDFGSRLVQEAHRNRIESHSLTGTAGSIAANRISYAFDFRGPSIAVDTACSSSLTAVHLACRSMAVGECEVALAGGVNLFLRPETAIAMAKASMLSPDGRSKAFDAHANGYVRGEGAGVVVLKPLATALRDGDRIHAVVRATAVNQDGRTLGMTVPSEEAQVSMMRQALKEAGVRADDVQYVEAHGTGTAAGDPVEARAIGRVFGERAAGATCAIGSVKTNIGHLEAAAGIAGLIKAALALEYRTIPASLHFETPNPAIPFEDLRLRVATALETWPAPKVRAMAAVNSFGVGGANAHAVLEEPPVEAEAEQAPGDAQILLLSAKTPEGLRETARRHNVFLRESPKPIGDICFTAAVRRSHHPHRMAVVAASREGLLAGLDEEGGRAISGTVPHGEAPRVAFAYSGMGLQRPGMGLGLWRSEPVFREQLERCDAVARPWTGWSLLEALANEDASRARQPEIAQVTNFALQVALTALWHSWGVVPDRVVGHSVGEVAAAYASGVLSLEDGLRLCWHRGRLAQRVWGKGGMLVAALPAEAAAALVARYDSRVVLAAVNSPASVTLSGDSEALEQIAAHLETRQLFSRFVPVNVPYHGPALDPFRDELMESLGPVAPRKPEIPMVSTVAGEWVNGMPLGPEHWWAEFRSPVQFARSIALLIGDGVELFVEIGPHASLRAPISECLAGVGRSGAVIASLKRGEDDRTVMLRAAAELHVRGRRVDWRNVFRGRGRVVALPSYPWQRESFGTGRIAGEHDAAQPAGNDSGHPLLGVRLPSARACWHADLADPRLGWLEGHVVQDAMVYPAAAYIEASLAAAEQMSPDGHAVLERMEFRKMMTLPKSRAVTVQWVSVPGEGFEILSRSDTDSSWVVHAAGRVRSAAAQSGAMAFDLEAIRARCGSRVGSDEWYAEYERRGLRYGGAFRGVSEVWRGEDEALGHVRLEDDTGGYIIHPALLDGALQVAGVLSDGAVERNVTLLPTSAACVRRHGRAAGSQWVYARLRSARGDAFESDVHILDDCGREVLAVEGLRCRLIGEVSRGPGELLYRTRWHEHVLPHASVQPLSSVIAAARDAAPRFAAESGIGSYDLQIEEALTGLAVEYIRSADLDRLCIAPRHRQFSGRLRQIDRELPPRSRADAGVIARALREAQPGWAHVIDLVSRCGEALADVLTGKQDAHELFFSPESIELLSRFYRNSPFFAYYNLLVGDLVAGMCTGASNTRKLRILELGAGTGGTTSSVLQRIPEGAAEYVFSDVSPFFLARARDEFTQRRDVHYALLDVESGTNQELPHGEFDVVVAADVLHATGNLAAALSNVKRRLAPGGVLILLECVRAIPWVDFLFGHFEGWWRFTGDRSRNGHPLLPVDRWEEALRAAGFDAVESMPAPACEHLTKQAVLVARRPMGRWLIVEDRKGVACAVAGELDRRGAVYRQVDAGDGDLAGDGQEWAGVIHLASLDHPATGALTHEELVEYQTATYDGVVRMLRAWSTRKKEPPPLWLVTAGAQAIQPNEAVPNVPQAGLWGMGRVLATESPNARCHLADLPAECSPREIELLVDAILSGDDEDELAFRGGVCFAARVLAAAPGEFLDESERIVRVDSGQVRLEVGATGSLDSLSLRQLRPMRPAPNELLVQVHAAGLNFRDIMLALGLMTPTAPVTDSRLPLGLECAGVVLEVGQDVRDFRPGDEVIGLTHGAFASHAIVRAAAAVRRPACLGWNDSAAILAAFTTVHHGLHELARVGPEDRVLIHSATGGVGLAAVQLCVAAGAEIFATAGSEEKRALLRSMGVAHVMDSRTLAFADEIMAITKGEGIDVILNSLPGEAISKGLAILRSSGRFVEIGKRDLLDNSPIGLAPFEKMLSFFAVDLDRLFRERTARVGQLAAEVAREFEAGRFMPLPRTDFPITEAPAAFRMMSQARHVGKIVLTVDEAEYRARPTRAQTLFRRDYAYLITGGLGGFGLAVAKWMLSHGARHIVLMGRRERPAPENEHEYGELLRTGCIKVMTGDVSREADVARILSAIRTERPLGGVVHAAMTLDDGGLLDLTARHWRTVLAPKVAGAWLLDRLTALDDLDCFVMFSSAASIVGSPMQANYAAANAFLDSLAQDRRARGLPGLTVSWGMLSGTGYVSRRPEVRRYLDRVGHRGITVGEALDCLEAVWRGPYAHAIAGRVDWAEFKRSFPSSGRRRFSGVAAFSRPEQAAPAAEMNSIVGQLRGGTPDERLEAACAYVRHKVAAVLTEPEDRIDPDMPLTNLGLDSLMAVELQTLFHTELGIRIAATRLLQGIAVRGLGDIILAQLTGEPAPKAAPATPATQAAAATEVLRPAVLPLASEQQRLWFLQQLRPRSPVYNMSLAVRLAGDLQLPLLCQALQEVTQRHEALRATLTVEDGRPAQIIAPRIEVPVPEADLSSLTDRQREEEVARLKEQETAVPFEICGAPLIRARVLRLSRREHVLLITAHHLVVDAWSAAVIARDTTAIYQRLVEGADPALPVPAPGYADFIARRDGACKAADDLAFWQRELARVPPLALPTDRPHPAEPTFGGGRLEFALDERTFTRLEQLGRGEGATLFMTLLAAFEVLLHRYTGQADFCVGTPVATRAREEAFDRVGCLVNTLAMRARVASDMTFRELLRGVRETVLHAFEHQDLSWERVVEGVRPERDARRTPVFQVLLVVHQIVLKPVELPGLSVTPEYLGNRGTTFDLVLLIDVPQRRAAIEYNTDVFDAGTIARWRGHLGVLLEEIERRPDAMLCELGILTESERRMLMGWNAASAQPRRDACLHELVEAQARRTPDAPAVIGESERYTYAELDGAANRLAMMLMRRGVGLESRVAVCLERSASAVVAILAILKAGGAFVPVDPAYPRERVVFMLRDCDPCLVLTNPRTAVRVPEEFAGIVLAVDAATLAGGQAVERPASPVTPANLAYLMYTSGSTGEPKGVLIEHRAICNQVLWRQNAFPLNTADAVLHTTSPSFDPSVWEIFGPLSSGAAVVIPAGPSALDGTMVRQAIRTHGVSVIQGVPSLLRSLVDQGALAGCDTLRHVFCGGERLDPSLVDALRRQSQAEVHQLYGCTETAIDATCMPRLPSGEKAALPVGWPIENVRTYILDQARQPVPQGVAGELYVGGAGVARGYWKRPELDVSRFLADPFLPGTEARMYRTGDLARYRPDGDIELLGRADRQIKLRGCRIEPDEVEAVLTRHEAVREAVVGLRGTDGDASLTAWLAPREGVCLTAAEISAFVLERVPRVMAPRAWVFLDALPRTPDGKLDATALPDPLPAARARADDSREPTGVERQILAVWKDILAVSQVGIHENFFDLGGHSLLAVRLASRLSAELGIEVPVSEIFTRPTVAALAHRMERNTGA